MSEPVLLERVADGVSALTLNRPEKRNALNAPLVEALRAAVARAATDDAVRVITLAGAGPDFCAGADLAELERVTTEGREASLRDARSLAGLFAEMRACPRPIVALVHGRALAGGCGLATACDLVLAREDAELGYPEVHLGFVPALVMTLLRRKVGEGRAFELTAVGARHGAREALELGLVNRVYAAGAFEELAGRYVADLASRPPGALARIKRLLYELDGLSFEEGLERAALANVEVRASEECRAGVRAFLARSAARSRAPGRS
ncbi:MAG TPA: enoyl-CoA hydratase-related protein [Longimicrobiales bacterium]|nr:enoyl-CoA hydratase-related protein [Longimicrobiales bacterium]